MSSPVLTYPEAVFAGKWPGWNTFLGAEKAEAKRKPTKKAKKKREGK